MLTGHRLADLLTPLLDSSATDIHAVGSVALREQRLRQAVLARRQGCSELRIPSPLFLSEPKSAAPGGRWQVFLPYVVVLRFAPHRP